MQNSVKCQFFLILLLSLVFNPATASAPADSTDAALDSLLLSFDNMELDEIVVVSRRNIVESDGALTVGCFAGNIFNRYQTYRETVRSNDMVLRSACAAPGRTSTVTSASR